MTWWYFCDNVECLIGYIMGDLELLLNARSAIDKARKRSSPIIFIKDEHPSSMADFGRELDGKNFALSGG